MSHEAASEFPALAHAFSGYLHEDFVIQYGTAAAALQAFREDASPAEWRRVQREATRFLKLVSTGEFDDACALIQKLGSRWIPPSREALIALLTELR